VVKLFVQGQRAIVRARDQLARYQLSTMPGLLFPTPCIVLRYTMVNLPQSGDASAWNAWKG
jgi:hypothetical protein